jgi:hypothetical protein
MCLDQASTVFLQRQVRFGVNQKPRMMNLDIFRLMTAATGRGGAPAGLRPAFSV